MISNSPLRRARNLVRAAFATVVLPAAALLAPAAAGAQSAWQTIDRLQPVVGADGALHEVTALRLSALTLDAMKSRNGLPENAVEDVIWGNATQVGEQGGCLAPGSQL